MELLTGGKCPDCERRPGEKVFPAKPRAGSSAAPAIRAAPIPSECQEPGKIDPDEILEKPCPKCGKPLVKRYSRKTRQYFIGCSGYPACTHIENSATRSSASLPAVRSKPLTKRFSRKTRRYFVGCSGYPECKFARRKRVKKKITIIGGGLAGVEAAYQAAKSGHRGRPARNAAAGDDRGPRERVPGRMVCSNSLGSKETHLRLRAAEAGTETARFFFPAPGRRARVPAGSSLSVDRLRLAADITRELAALPGVRVIRQRDPGNPGRERPAAHRQRPADQPRSPRRSSGLTMRKNLYFFDATCPLVRAETIDFGKMFAASRYEKGDADFCNIPLDESQYDSLVEHMVARGNRGTRGVRKKHFFRSLPADRRDRPPRRRNRWPSARSSRSA